MFLATVLLVSVVISLAAAVLIDNAYQAIANGRWLGVSLVAAVLAAAAGVIYGAPLG
jgi:hypothetical protein